MLNLKSDQLDVNLTFQSKGGEWSSSTKLGPEDNVTKYNFPLAFNYPSHVSTGTIKAAMAKGQSLN